MLKCCFCCFTVKLITLLSRFCSESSRLVGESSHCAGTLELKHEGQWRPVSWGDDHWSRGAAAAFCTVLDCGPLVSLENGSLETLSVWNVKPNCFQFGSVMKECISPGLSGVGLYITCLGKFLFLQLNFSGMKPDVEHSASDRRFCRSNTKNLNCRYNPQRS